MNNVEILLSKLDKGKLSDFIRKECINDSRFQDRFLALGGALKKKIENFFESNRETNAVVVDSSSVLLGESEYTEFVENYAMALAIANSDIDQRKTYESSAFYNLPAQKKKF